MIRRQHKKMTTGWMLGLLLAPGVVLAADAPDFFQNGIGARPQAMGGAFVAIANDVNAIYYNPAGMVTAPKSQFSLMRHGFNTLDIETNHIAYLHRLTEDSAVGLSLMLTTNENNFFTSYSAVGGTNRPLVGSSFTEKETGFMISYGKRMSEKTSFGSTARYFSHKLAGSSETGFGLDLGLLHQQSRNLSLGINLQNIVPTDLGQDRIPFNAKIGAAYTTSDGNLTLAADVNTDNGGDGSSTVNFGLEYQVTDGLRLRAGSEDDGYTLGVGIGFQDWQVDYAYQDKGIGNISRIGFNYYPDVNAPTRKAVKQGPVIKNEAPPAQTVVITRDISKPSGKEMRTDIRIIQPGEALINLGQIDKLKNGDKLAVLFKGKVSAMVTITDAGRFFSQSRISEKGYEGTLVKGTLLGDAVVLIED